MAGNSVDVSSWMENLPNEKQLSPLKDLVIPGSHDSGTFSLDKNMEIGPDEPNLIRKFGKLVKPVVYNWSVTQSMTIYEQLRSGIRYLDLRVAYRTADKNSEIRVLHGLFGWTIDQVLDEVNRFVANYPKEIVILDFNHFYKMDQAAHKKTCRYSGCFVQQDFTRSRPPRPECHPSRDVGKRREGHHYLSRL